VQGIICEPRGNIVAHFAWGLGTTSNNIAEAYAFGRVLISLGIRGSRGSLFLPPL